MRIVYKDRNRQRKVLVTETMSAASVPFVAGPASEWRRGEHTAPAGISHSTFRKPSSHVYQADARKGGERFALVENHGATNSD
jgi:hypothetical protein